MDRLRGHAPHAVGRGSAAGRRGQGRSGLERGAAFAADGKGINNVLGFPFLFRGALDVHARTINTAMKVAASEALAALAREPVPADVQELYPQEKMVFGNGYIIPKPFDKRLFTEISFAVAKAAVESGAAPADTDLAAIKAGLIARNAART